ncbi:Phosphonopyruvate decarboxylase protein [Burkholderia cenocepacia]|nr:Phosphonopyruvate decarboxylase protein [Burkholderia cenocepacia]
MIGIGEFVDVLIQSGITFFTGVPDSLLGGLSTELEARCSRSHVIACNEGSAVALAIGAFAASGAVPMVYLQNSGIGNAHNPLVSLAHGAIFGAPMLLVIGWRAEVLPDGNQISDEPQHRIQGRATLGHLDLIDIPYEIVDGTRSTVERQVRELIAIARKRRTPVALIVRKGALGASRLDRPPVFVQTTLSREMAIEHCLDALPAETAVVATTGMASRELFELRSTRGDDHDDDLLIVGGMGHASQIALGMTIVDRQRRVACIDGDGAFYMHLGAATQVRHAGRLIHIVMNNGVHDSVGGMPTAGEKVDMCAIARACGYPHVHSVDTASGIAEAIRFAVDGNTPFFLEIRCRGGSRPGLGRPTQAPRENFDAFCRGST